MSSFLTERRETLAHALAGATLSAVGAVESVKTLPAIVLEPSPQWLDAQLSPSGPGRQVVCQLRGRLLVKAAESEGALDALEEEFEGILERLPKHWRFDRAEPPAPLKAGEIDALGVEFFVSFNYSLTP